MRDMLRYAMRRVLHTSGFGMGGWWPSVNPSDLEPNMLSRARNVFTFNGCLQTWPGDLQRGTLQGSSNVMGFANLLSSGQADENFFWDRTRMHRWVGSSTDNYEYIYETYTKGTVAQTSGATVTGNAGTDWATRDTTTGTRIYNGEGSEFKLNADSDSAYTVISTVGSDTSLTLAQSYAVNGGTIVGPAATAAYTIRKRFRGSALEFFAATEFQGDLYFSQGVDSLRKFDANANTVSAVADDTTPGNVPAASILEVFARRIVAAGIADYARATPTPQLIAWSTEADPSDWSGVGSGFRNFIETPGAVRQIKAMDQNLMVYKEFDILIGTRTNQAEPPFTFEPFITSRRHGCLAGRSVVPIEGAGHMYLGQDDFYLLTLGGTRVRGGPVQIRDFVFPLLNRDALSRCQGELATPFRKVLYLLPTGQGTSGQPMLFVYDYMRDLWDSYLEPGSGRTIWSMGRFYRPSDDVTSYGSLVGTYADQTFRYGMEPAGSGGESLLFGSSVGNIDEVGFDRGTYRGEIRNPVMVGPAIYINKPSEDGVLCRVTLKYRQPRATTAPFVIVSLIKSEGGGVALGSDSFQLLSDSPGAVSTAYFDFIVSAERIQPRVTCAGFLSLDPLVVASSQLELLEISAEVTDAGVETPSS